HRALPLLARRQPHGEVIANAHAVDVGLLDIRAHPEAVRVDEGDDRLTGADIFARADGAHVHDAGDRRVYLGVRQPDVGLARLRGRGGLRLARPRERAPLHGHLVLRGAGERHGRLLRGRLEARFGDREPGVRRIHLLRRHGAGAQQRYVALVHAPRVHHAGGILRGLRDRRGQRRLRLSQLLGGLRFLIAQIGLRLLHLGSHGPRAMRVIGLIGLQLVRREYGEQLILPHRVALRHQEPAHLAAHLRTHDHVAGGDDPVEVERAGPAREEIRDHGDDGDHGEAKEDGQLATHARAPERRRALPAFLFKRVYKTIVSIRQGMRRSLRARDTGQRPLRTSAARRVFFCREDLTMLTLSHWRPANLFAAWGAYWAGLAAVTLAPAALAVLRATSSGAH